MKVVDIADEIFRETGSSSDTSVAAISFWIRSNVGAMNNHLNTTFAIDSTTLEISYTNADDEVVSIDAQEVAVLKQMYIVYDYDTKLRSILGAASWDSVLEVSDAGTRVRKVNKSEMGKTLALTKKQEQEQLSKLISSYKIRESSPRQVAGDDTAEGKFPEEPIDRSQYPN